MSNQFENLSAESEMSRLAQTSTEELPGYSEYLDSVLAQTPDPTPDSVGTTERH